EAKSIRGPVDRHGAPDTRCSWRSSGPQMTCCDLQHQPYGRCHLLSALSGLRPPPSRGTSLNRTILLSLIAGNVTPRLPLLRFLPLWHNLCSAGTERVGPTGAHRLATSIVGPDHDAAAACPSCQSLHVRSADRPQRASAAPAAN